MPGVGVAVHDGAGEVAVLLERFLDPPVDHGGAQGDVARGDALGQAHDVGLDPPQAATEHRTAAAEAGDHFVGDQQHAVLVANLADQWPVVGRRHDDPARALDRLGDEGRHGVRALELDFPLQQVGADLAQLLWVLAVGVAVQPRSVDVVAAGQQRLVVAPEHRIAVDRGATEVGAVVALAQGNELGAIGLALQLPVLASQLQGAFDGVRAARAEGHAAHVFRLQQVHQDPRQFLGAGMADPVEQLEVLQLIELGGDGRLHFLAVVANVDVPQPGHAIHQLTALVVVHIAAIAAHDADRFALLHLVGVQHGMPEMACLAHVGSPDRARTAWGH